MKFCVQRNPVSWLNRFPVGMEPTTARLTVLCLSHSATLAPTAIKSDQIYPKKFCITIQLFPHRNTCNTNFFALKWLTKC